REMDHATHGARIAQTPARRENPVTATIQVDAMAGRGRPPMGARGHTALNQHGTFFFPWSSLARLGVRTRLARSMENRSLSAWVDEVARQTQPERVVWCDGSAAEYQ